jgi:hypothetical protein
MMIYLLLIFNILSLVYIELNQSQILTLLTFHRGYLLSRDV